MTKYIIPITNIEELSKKINSIKNKGVDVVFNILKEVKIKHYLESGQLIYINCVEVEVDTDYTVDEWTFVATIEHSEVGNILRVAKLDLEKSIPSKYQTAGRECEHCNKIRDRKDTYLVYNNNTKEFRQVGRTCLKDYTGGLDVNIIAQLLDVHGYIAKLEREDKIYVDDILKAFIKGLSGPSLYHMKTKEIKKPIYSYVKENGYISKVTVDNLVKLFFGTKKLTSEATDLEIKEMDDWVNTIESNSQYMKNAKVAWTKEYSDYRDLALFASLVNVFLKEKAQRHIKSNDSANIYVGTIKDRITLTNLKSIRVAYTKTSSRYSYYDTDSYLYEIIDGDGHTYIWSTTEPNLENRVNDIESITATIKDHKEYKGTKQTVITRGRVKYKEPDKDALEKQREQNKKSMNELSDYFDYLNSLDED